MRWLKDYTQLFDMFICLQKNLFFVFSNNWLNILHIWLSPYLKFLFNDQFVRLDDQYTGHSLKLISPEVMLCGILSGFLHRNKVE